MANHLAHHAGEKLVFPSPGGTLINPSNWRKRTWQPAVAAAGLEGVTFHALRHSSASLLVPEGVNAKVIQTRLGHSDVRTTLQVHGHLYEGWDDAAADALDVAFGSAADNSRTSSVLPFAPQLPRTPRNYGGFSGGR